eukprot:TRINITY_DN75120_c0_g1_i1.p1 TRINITY_DN75120_c0_g1~~TRINITY_DN75120_c0_g1_i1.p1  ORF type:complete len:111 (-),score=16.36 TRINITY_DN75120_c0_g1_i1:191-523(-)
MVVRVTYRRKHTYQTKSNMVKIVKTPGGRYVLHKIKKLKAGPHTAVGLGHKQIMGVQCARHTKGRRSLLVKRAYGGTLTHKQVRERIIRAFLIEEQKIVKSVLRNSQKRR